VHSFSEFTSELWSNVTPTMFFEPLRYSALIPFSNVIVSHKLCKISLTWGANLAKHYSKWAARSSTCKQELKKREIGKFSNLDESLSQPDKIAHILADYFLPNTIYSMFLLLFKEWMYIKSQQTLIYIVLVPMITLC
jgi:hypothetical protein